MKILKYIPMIIVVILLILAAYIIYQRLPGELKKFEEFESNISKGLPVTSNQFYPNMRYPDKKITYSLSDSCSQKKKEDFIEATAILEEETILQFFEVDEGQIIISCSNITPKSEEEGHFILGEGGPSSVFNLTNYAVITDGKIALYRDDSCEKPEVALHELLHALGFDHNSNKKSILYPISDCDQTLDQEIIETIDYLYEQESYGDLEIEKASAEKSGPYLNFEITVSNEGLKEISESTLIVKIESKEIEEFDLGKIELGEKIISTVTNVRIPRDTEIIIFEVRTQEQEISKENNFVELSTEES